MKLLSLKNLLSYRLLYYNWGTSFEEWFKKEFGAYTLPALRVDHPGLALRLMIDHDYIGFMMESLADQWIKKDRLIIMSYEAKMPIPPKWIYLVYLKSRKNDHAIKSFLSFLEEQS